MSLNDKMFEIAHLSGDRYQLEQQIVQLRADMETLKLECPHNEEWLRHKNHKFTQDWGVSYWTTSECANCGSVFRSKDETYLYRVEED